MEIYEKIAHYVETVQNKIHWVRAKKVVASCITDQIHKKIDGFAKYSENDDIATDKAIDELGDATILGEKLNQKYRPKINWGLCILIAVLIFVGFEFMLLWFQTQKGFIYDFSRQQNVLVMGLVICLFFYFLDYTVLIRYSKGIYFSLVIATILSYMYELRNTNPEFVGSFYTFYLLMLFPVALIFLAFYFRMYSNHTVLWLSAYTIFPLGVASFLLAWDMILLIIISMTFAMVYMLRYRWFTYCTYDWLIWIAVIITIIYIFSQLWMQKYMVNWSGAINTTLWMDLKNTPFVGSIENGQLTQLEANYFFLWYTSLVGMVFQYGWIAYIIVGILFLILFIYLFQMSYKQRNTLGKLLSYMLLCILFLQFLLCFLNDVGIFSVSNGTRMTLPFFLSGGVIENKYSISIFYGETSILIDFVFIGLVLSIYRQQKISNELISYHLKRLNEE